MFSFFSEIEVWGFFMFLPVCQHFRVILYADLPLCCTNKFIHFLDPLNGLLAQKPREISSGKSVNCPSLKAIEPQCSYSISS